MKCWNPLFNAQGSRLILVIVRVGEVEIYVAAIEALRQKERQDETQFTTKIDGFLNFKPNWMLMYLFAAF
jgi:cell shape-determining protein MreD